MFGLHSSKSLIITFILRIYNWVSQCLSVFGTSAWSFMVCTSKENHHHQDDHHHCHGLILLVLFGSVQFGSVWFSLVQLSWVRFILLLFSCLMIFLCLSFAMFFYPIYYFVLPICFCLIIINKNYFKLYTLSFHISLKNWW